MRWLVLLALAGGVAEATETGTGVDPARCPWHRIPVPVVDAADKFVKVEGLGSDAPISLVVKKAQKDHALNEKRKSDKVEGVSDNRKVYKGFVALLTIGHLGEPEKAVWKQDADMPHGFAQGRKVSVVASTDRIFLVDPKTGERLEEIADPRFKSLHTVEFNPENPDRILIASSGNNTLFEYDLKTRKIVWEWRADLHGFNINNWGAHFVPKGTPIKLEPGVRVLSYEEAKAKAQAGEKIPEGETWYVEYEGKHRDGPIGQERWARTAYPNWAGYGRNPNEILVTLYVTGDVLRIDRATGKHELVRSGLSRPHGLVAFEDGYVISDTRKGQVQILDKDFKPIRAIDFSKFPITLGDKDLGFEWLQHTNPIGNGLLATIDARRSRVYVWNPKTLEYSIYPMNSEWEVQSITHAPN